MKTYNTEKKGYNYRITCLQSLSSVLPYLQKDQISKQIIPLFAKALNDDIPNVRFTVCQILVKQNQQIDQSTYIKSLVPVLQDLLNDDDMDVRFFSQ